MSSIIHFSSALALILLFCMELPAKDKDWMPTKILPRTVNDMIYFLPTIDKKCQTSVQLTFVKLQAYQESLGSTSNDSHPEILGTINAILEKSQAVCEESVKQAYLLGSLFLSLDLTNISRRSQEIPIKSWPLPFYILINKMLVANRINLSWTETLVEHKTLGTITKMGEYDCARSTVSIDLQRTPYDLGALLKHELSHLFRDKFFTPGQLAFFFGTDSSAWHKFLVLDEALAIGHQMEGQVVGLPKEGAQPKSEKDFYSFKVPQKDHSFIDHHQKLAKLLLSEEPFTNRLSYTFFDLRLLVPGTKDNDTRNLAQEIIGELLQQVELLYFNSRNSSATSFPLAPHAFAIWPNFNFSGDYLKNSGDQDLEMNSSDFLMQTKDQKYYLRIQEPQLNSLKVFIDRLVPGIDFSTSSLCQAYLHAAKSGLLQNYLGGSPKDEGSYPKPGGEGGKGSFGWARSCFGF